MDSIVFCCPYGLDQSFEDLAPVRLPQGDFEDLPIVILGVIWDVDLVAGRSSFEFE